jgi:RHS repeat-associated protein
VISLGSTVSTVFARRPDGKTHYYSLSNGSWVGDEDDQDRLSQLAGGQWQLVTAGDATEIYDANGVLQSITDHAGRIQTLTYSDGTAGPNGGYYVVAGNSASSVLPAGLLIRVTDASGRALNFGYDNFGRIIQMTDPAGGITSYGYQPSSIKSSLLTSVTYPDSSKRTYWYNEQANTSNTNQPHALTGITDENGVRYATYQYDAQGRAIVTEHGPDMANGPAGRYTLAYNTNGTTTVTDPLNTARTYGFTTILGVVKNTTLSQPCASCGSDASIKTYDANGNVASKTDFNGNTSCYAYDLSRNLETARLEGVAPGKACPANLTTYTPAANTVERKISTQWDATYHLPSKVAEPNKLTSYSYDSSGNLLTRTEQQTTDATGGQGLNPTVTGTARTWAYTYAGSSEGLPGQVKTVNGPRTDVTDITTYTYYTDTAADHHPGDLSSVTNALGHVTTYDRYDGNGRLLQTTDPNGLVTTLDHYPRGWLRTRTRGTETTSYTYDFAGNLTQVQYPSGETYTYTYDAAHRLTDITDPDGNHLHYTLDGMGNRTLEQILDASSHILYSHSRQFNALNQLWKDIGAVNQTATYTYDSNGNLKTVDGPRTDVTDVTQNQYDALNRLISSTAPDTGITKYGYNGLEWLTSVTDPNNLNTAYTLDAWGDQLQTSSPDTGTTIRSFDEAGNLKTEQDNRGITTTYTYDALNRVLSKSSSDAATPAYSYVYDSPCGMGRLCTIQRNGVPQLSCSYDSQGRLSSQLDASSGSSLTSQYAYDTQGRLAQITYPTGRTVTYGYDTRGRVNQLSTTFNGTTTVLASSFVYQAFGPVKSYTFGNNTTYSTSFDQDYRVALDISGPRSKTATYDLASNLSILSDIDITQQSYGYDANGRLINGNDTRLVGWGALAWTYDKNGNRKTDTRNGAATAYAYTSGTDRLASVSPTGGAVQNRSYDAMGNTQTIGSSAFTYDGYGRMITAPSTTYDYNALGQRTGKTVSSTATTFHYGPDGQLLYEASGTSTKVYVYLNGKLLARIDNNSAIYYYHTDQLGAPQVMTDSAGTTVWSARTEPFGVAAISTQTIVNNLRLTGQYCDAETGLHYNYFRDYDPGVGRYVETDPIGLLGGVNPYTYVDGNPLSKADPFGLAESGGPYHPPEGVSLRCTNADTCPQLEGKMQQLKRMIDSHEGWDRNNPAPRGGGRHAEEIANLWNAYARCQAIHVKKCCDSDDESGFSKWWRSLTGPQSQSTPSSNGQLFPNSPQPGGRLTPGAPTPPIGPPIFVP